VKKDENAMEWTTPTWAEIKMDAEIGSYQEDFEPTRDPIVDSAESDSSVEG
jgi:hypothetical protein